MHLPAPASQPLLGDSCTISYSRVSVLQPGGFGDTSVDTVDTEPHFEAPMQHVVGRLAVPGASAAAEVKVFMDSGSGITAMSEAIDPCDWVRLLGDTPPILSTDPRNWVWLPVP